MDGVLARDKCGREEGEPAAAGGSVDRAHGRAGGDPQQAVQAEGPGHARGAAGAGQEERADESHAGAAQAEEDGAGAGRLEADGDRQQHAAQGQDRGRELEEPPGAEVHEPLAQQPDQEQPHAEPGGDPGQPLRRRPQVARQQDQAGPEPSQQKPEGGLDDIDSEGGGAGGLGGGGDGRGGGFVHSGPFGRPPGTATSKLTLQTTV